MLAYSARLSSKQNCVLTSQQTSLFAMILRDTRKKSVSQQDRMKTIIEKELEQWKIVQRDAAKEKKKYRRNRFLDSAKMIFR